MTGRKPLVWVSTTWGDVPDCRRCVKELASPGFAQAVASVSIEHPTPPYDLARRVLDGFHANRHRSPP